MMQSNLTLKQSNLSLSPDLEAFSHNLSIVASHPPFQADAESRESNTRFVSY